ncbi:MAG: serine/threonine-protein phosphatase [Pirellulales bacterium]|nr:serine/threonine-protein phosphatase [Pirellulales bacterium]
METRVEYLRVYSEQPSETPRPEPLAVESLPKVIAAFEQATGWPLEHVPGPKSNSRHSLTWSTPVSPGVGPTLGHLSLGRRGSTSDAPPATPIDQPTAEHLAEALDALLQELSETELALRDREAELAAGVTPLPTDSGEGSLAERLEAVLKGGAEAVGAHAAALYLLDEITSELKLRSVWGLPRSRLRKPARPLAGALADLEAMLGHAVVLEDARIMQRWKVPEDFASAVCVPVSSPTTILGTLWIFSRDKRDFNERQTNVIEVTAGRLAADLERETLLGQGAGGTYWRHQLAAAERAQRGSLPTMAPLLDDWQTAGWVAQADQLGGDFFDWFCLPESRMAIALGDAAARGVEGALSAGAVKASFRSHAQYQRRAEQLLGQVNLTLWTGSSGDQSANLFAGLVDTASGEVHFGSAGQLGVMVVRPGGWESLSQPSPALGVSPESQYQGQTYELQPGESLVVFSDGFREAIDRQGRPLGEAGLAEALVDHAGATAEQLVRIAQNRLATHAAAPEKMDRAVLVVKRTPT